MAKAKSVRTPKYRRQKRPKSPDEAIVELSRAWWRTLLWLGVLRETLREQFGGERRMKE